MATRVAARKRVSAEGSSTMARTAAACDCPVEVVEQSDALIHLGGVGCLLSYRLPDEY